MVVKFNKKQVKALAAIHFKAVAFFNELHAEKPELYREEYRESTIRSFEAGILENIIETGTTYLED